MPLHCRFTSIVDNLNLNLKLRLGAESESAAFESALPASDSEPASEALAASHGSSDTGTATLSAEHKCTGVRAAGVCVAGAATPVQQHYRDTLAQS